MTAMAPLGVSRGRRARPAAWARAVVPAAAVIAGACAALVVTALAVHPAAGVTRAVLAVVLAGVALLFAAAVLADRAARREAARQVLAVREIAVRWRADVEQAAGMLARGQQPAAVAQADLPRGSGVFQLLTADIEQSRRVSLDALVQAAALLAALKDRRVEIFVNLAGRLQSLVHREIGLLDDLENRVEDPVLLGGLFKVDHLATRVRRYSESLAVLGGQAPRRQ